MRPRMRRGTLLVVSAMLGLSCTADDRDSTQDGAFESTTPTASMEAPLQGRILFFSHDAVGRVPSLQREHRRLGGNPIRAGGRVRGEAPLAGRHPARDLRARTNQGLLVGGTVGVDGSGYRLFATTDPSLNLVCGVWAPRGRLACEGWDDGDSSRAGIYTVRASDGTDAQRLTRQRDIPCEYSPDGTQLAFVRTVADDGRGTLMVMDAAGGEARDLLDDVVLTGIPCDWSPDGSSILASSAGALHFVTTRRGELAARG